MAIAAKQHVQTAAGRCELSSTVVLRKFLLAVLALSGEDLSMDARALRRHVDNVTRSISDAGGGLPLKHAEICMQRLGLPLLRNGAWGHIERRLLELSPPGPSSESSAPVRVMEVVAPIAVSDSVSVRRETAGNHEANHEEHLATTGETQLAILENETARLRRRIKTERKKQTILEEESADASGQAQTKVRRTGLGDRVHSTRSSQN